MILCVGASGCGKTSLLKILKQKCVQENAGNQEGGKDAKKTEEEPQIPDTRYPAAISTVGTDILTLPGRGIYSRYFIYCNWLICLVKRKYLIELESDHFNYM